MKITASAERRIHVPADQVYGYIRDYQGHHPYFLPSEFGRLVVEAGGVGAGTVIRFPITVAGRTRTMRARIDEPEPGRVLTETDLEDGAITTWTVEATGEFECLVRIETAYERRGLRGMVERMTAPGMLEHIYDAELRLLGKYAHSRGRTMEMTVIATSTGG